MTQNGWNAVTVEAQTYFLIDNEFVPVEEITGRMRKATDCAGAIELSVNGVVMMDRTMWDAVVLLWAFIVNGLDEISQGRSHECFFPDQPLELSFELLKNGRVLFRIGDISQVNVGRENFIRAMAHEAGRFFSFVSDISGDAGAYASKANILKRIEHRIS